MFMVTKRRYQLSGILCLLLTLSFSLYSCSEESGTEDEYADWQTRNDAIVKVWANDPSLTRIKSYTEDPTTEGDRYCSCGLSWQTHPLCFLSEWLCV